MAEKSPDFANVRPPFSAYDIFGYIIPASVFVICVYLFDKAAEKFVTGHHHPVLALFRHAVPPENATTYAIWVHVAAAIIGVYVLGHLVATTGSIALDRLLVTKGHGYPADQLLALPEISKHGWSQSFYRGAFFWFNFLVWAFLGSATLGIREFPFWCGVIIAAVGFLAVCHFYRKFLEDLVVGAANSRMNSVFSIGLKWFAAPYNWLWNRLDTVFNWKEPMNPQFLSQYKAEFERAFRRDMTDAKTDNYWLCSLAVLAKQPIFASMLTNWHHLYSFCRNVAASFYLAFLYGCAYVTFVQVLNTPFSSEGKRCLIGTTAIF